MRVTKFIDRVSPHESMCGDGLCELALVAVLVARELLVGSGCEVGAVLISRRWRIRTLPVGDRVCVSRVGGCFVAVLS